MHISTATWCDPTIISRAGIIIYLAHIAQPDILKIEHRHGRRFTNVETLESSVRRTASMITITFHHGLNDPQVAAQVASVAAHHRTMGIRPWMMSYIAATIAVAPCWVLGHSYDHADSDYHAALRAFTARLGATLPVKLRLEPWLRGTIKRRGETTAAGIADAALLARRYPEQMRAIATNDQVPQLLRFLAEEGAKAADLSAA